MSDNNENTAGALPDAAIPHAIREGTNPQRPFVWSVCALIAGAIALGLAAIPAIALERPLPNPFADPKAKPQPLPPPPMEREGGVTLKFKKLSVNIGGKVPPQKKEAVEAEQGPPLEMTKDPIRWFTMGAVGCALTGLVIGLVGHLRERHTVLTVGSMSCCVAAITWQYIAIGLMIGAGVAAFFIVLALLGPAIP